VQKLQYSKLFTKVKIDLILFLVFNTTFSKHFSYIMAMINLVVEEAGVLGENHRPWTSNWQTLLLAIASRVHPFLLFTKLGTNPSRIGNRLVRVVR
jgi:hypothetical protein